MFIKNIKSDNYSAPRNGKRLIRYIVIHYTGMQSERVSIRRLCNKNSKVSSHYLIGKKGNIVSMVNEKNIAWHAGKSKWKNIINLNNGSIGIELVNKGHSNGYENFSKMQVIKLISLCKILIKKYKIKKENILGHSDIAPLRKIDPGEKFPWYFLSKKEVGFWYKLSKKNIHLKNLNRVDLRRIFFKNLFKIGYRYFSLQRASKSDTKIVKAFQRRFRQNKINGLIDPETFKIAEYLAKTQKLA